MLPQSGKSSPEPSGDFSINYNNMALEQHREFILKKLSEGKTYQEISFDLKHAGVSRGSSAANLRRFCTEAGINPRADLVPQTEVEDTVEKAVLQVCAHLVNLS